MHEPPLDHFGRPDSGTAFAFAATEAGVRSAMEKMRDVLRAHDLGAMNVGLAEIVLAETCNNIVEHAYDNTGNGEIKISLRYTGGLLIAELTDWGKPMPGLEPPPKKTHDLDAALSDLPEGGFGWGLIRDMTSSLIYRRLEDRNFLRLMMEMTPETP